MLRSFYIGGFECGTGRNRSNHWIDLTSATHHDRRIMEDYTALYSLGILVAREGVRWPLIDKGNGEYDFTSLDPFLTRARYVGLQLILDLFHYGYPEDVDPFSEEFVERFAGYCDAVARHVCRNLDGPFCFTPINEPSYLAWAGGEVGLLPPYETGRGSELKLNLVRAAIVGIDTLRAIVPSARIVNVDPICHVATSPEVSENEALWFNEAVVYESWDMLSGRLMSSLGGSVHHLDIVGVNYYHGNQWELGNPDRLLDGDDLRWKPLSQLIEDVWLRYGQEIIVSATSDRDDRRGHHLEWVADEAESVLNDKIPLLGVCLYPVLGTPEWEDSGQWARTGLWDVDGDGNRYLHEPSAQALRYGQRKLENLAIPPGTYNFQWRMQQIGKGVFGEPSANVAITVTP